MKTRKAFFMAVGVAAFLLACNNPATPVADVQPIEEKSRQESDTVTIKDKDTITTNNYQLVFAPADSTTIPDFLEQQGIKITGGQMAYFTRYKDGIGLHLENGDTTLLKNDTSGAKEYQFFAHIPSINYHLVRVQYPKGKAYVLVNARTGEKAELVGLPYISPAGKYIVAVNQDLIAGHTPNAIQLLKIEKDSLTNLFTLQIKGWGPEKIKWLSDSSFILQKKTARENRAESRIEESTSYSLVAIHKK